MPLRVASTDGLAACWNELHIVAGTLDCIAWTMQVQGANGY